MTIYRFQSVTLRASKSGKCVCGKRVTRSNTFEQTINPFNKNSKGEIKNYNEIWAELKEEAAAWKSKPVYHSRVLAGNWDLSKKGIAVLSCGEQIPVEAAS